LTWLVLYIDSEYGLLVIDGGFEEGFDGRLVNGEEYPLLNWKI
jgi:hypothetical protein